MPRKCTCHDRAIDEVNPCAIVLFGATGDLTRRKLIPALYSLFRQGLLPERYAIVAFARRPKDDETFRDDIRDAVGQFAPNLTGAEDEWKRFASRVFYHKAELDDSEGYGSLKTRLEALDAQLGLNGNRLFYLATPPANFSTIAQHLGGADLVNRNGDGGWTRILVEKPFGYDRDSAQALNAVIRTAFREDQIYRIDHYLGKETVQNILVMRFANRLFELLWNHLYIDNVQITVAETLGVEGRGAYFDQAGIVRDIVQNHALQILTLVAMEPPVSIDADSIRDEKVKVLRSIRPYRPSDVPMHTVRAQYGCTGFGDELVRGYLQEQGVPPDSLTETYAAMRFDIDNWRWAGVPFYVRAGKRMPQRLTEVTLQLKDAPGVLFARLSCARVQPNRISLRIQPNEGVELIMSAKDIGPSMCIEPVRMHFDYEEAFGAEIPDAYERLLHNAMTGDASLFARDDEVDMAWALMAPILEQWAASPDPLAQYTSGTWGPRCADELLKRDGRRWWNR